MTDLTGYIPYRKAKRILNDRLQTSDDEIALWVSGLSGVTLGAYVIGFRGKLIPFLGNGSNPFGGENYIRPLEGLYFLPTEVEQFIPDKRFISWQALVERWKKYNNGDKVKTIDLIDGRRKGGLFEYHPVSGASESLCGEGFERGLFDLEKVEAVESELIPDMVEPLADAGAVGQAATELASVKVTQVFSKFINLRANEISLVMMENETARIVIRGKSIKVRPDELGLKAGSQDWKLMEGAAVNGGDLKNVLKRLNSSSNLEAEKTKIKTAVSRLRNRLKDAMGLKDDPILYMKGNGYKFTFKTMTHELLNGPNVSKGSDAMNYTSDKDSDENQHDCTGYRDEDE